MSILWFVAAGVLELLGIPFMFLEQNSPAFIFIIFAVCILILTMIIVYYKIETKYKTS